MTASTIDPASVAEQFAVRPGYLAAASLGLPHRGALAAYRAALDRWERGEMSAGDADDAVVASRRSYATIVGVPEGSVAIGANVSTQLGLIAASLGPGSRVVTAWGEFSSVTVPFESAGADVTHVPLAELAAGIVPGVDAVVFSLVQSSNGTIADVDAILAAAADVGALAICDTTQAVGVLPVDAGRFDVTVCHTYKWLSCPRGVSFMTFKDGRGERFRTLGSGWYSGDDIWASTYGPSVRLAPDARRFDTSPAFFSWIGAAPALDYFAQASIPDLWAHASGLGNRLCDGLGIEPKNQAIVSWPDPTGEQHATLSRAGITVSARDGLVRSAFHLWNTEADVRAVLTALHAA